jgi:hypothetical protein
VVVAPPMDSGARVVLVAVALVNSAVDGAVPLRLKQAPPLVQISCSLH